MDVLVVDDDAIARCSIEHVLRHGGYNVLTATNGREALNLLRLHPIQLVLVDWEMPVLDGIELCKAIRQGEFRHYVYVVMVTSRSRAADTVSGLEVGADDYVTKPFNPGELLMRVKTGQRIIGLESREMTIFALAKLAESRDNDTGLHLERVRSYCRVLAKCLQQQTVFPNEIDDAYIRLLYESSPLHDIGKVAIPDGILLKTGPLTTHEFSIMKTHTLRGAETIDSLICEFPNVPFLHMARDIILSHHEKYDGSGYPRGLAGTNIPLSGRIIAVADVYDALTSKRVYKSAYAHDTAKDIIANDAGKHFDPAIVEAFLASEQEFIAINRRYREASPAPEHLTEMCMPLPEACATP